MKNKTVLIVSFHVTLIVSLPFTFAATLSLTYDANGNLVTGDGKYRTYDGFNHLVQIRNGNNATGTILENLTWHPLEERILVKAVYETNGSWKENVYYISQSFVKIKNASGTYDYKYIYQNGQLIAQEFVGEKKNFMLNDHKGTVQVVVNESGAKVEETFYSPFGEIISGGATSRFDYEGKEYDSVVGDYDYHARKYCPGSGRFCQPDTLLPNVYDPQQLNRYSFERNNPFKYTDDDGNAIEFLPNVGAGIYNLEEGFKLALIYQFFAKGALVGGEYKKSLVYNYQSLEIILDTMMHTSMILTVGAKKTYEPVTLEINEIVSPVSNPYEDEAIIDSYYERLLKELNQEELRLLKIKPTDYRDINANKVSSSQPQTSDGRRNGGSGGGGGGKTSRQIAQEEVQKAKEQGGTGEYKENPNGGAQWSTVTPRKKG